MRFLVGLLAVGGAVWLSRSVRVGLADVVPADDRGEALKSLERAAEALYPTVNLNPLRTAVFSSEEYRPRCEDFAELLGDGANATMSAREGGMYGSDALGVAIAQYAALAEIDCPGVVPSWVQRAAP